MPTNAKAILSLFLKRLPVFIAVIAVALFFRHIQNRQSNEKAEEKNITPASRNLIPPAYDTLRPSAETKKDSVRKAEIADFEALPDSAFVELIVLDPDFVLDIRYATRENFMKKKVYPCAKALLRKKTALALLKAHKEFKEKGYRIKIYDAYRPLSVQWELWNATDKKQYVADPRKGSNHNRGCAVDLTLVKSDDFSEIPMGTEYDFFGKEAHHSYVNLPQEVLKNRQLLKTTLEKHGFRAVSHEWWHYDFGVKYPVSDFPLPCEEQKP